MNEMTQAKPKRRKAEPLNAVQKRMVREAAQEATKILREEMRKEFQKLERKVDYMNGKMMFNDVR